MRRPDDTGAGRPELVLVHGWGGGRHVWQGLVPALTPWYAVVTPELPGHGACPGPLARDINGVADAMLARAPASAGWLGWSLGGLVALAAAARAPDRVTALWLVASNPRFVAGDGWPGIDPAVLADFARDLDGEPMAVHDRFLALQVAGSERARPTLRALRTARSRDGLPSTTILHAGLDLLAKTDLRGCLPALSCPARAILGSHDRLAPVALGERFERAGIPVRVISGAGHAAWISHPEAFIGTLSDPGDMQP